VFVFVANSRYDVKEEKPWGVAPNPTRFLKKAGQKL
jgi:hypothetical protein